MEQNTYDIVVCKISLKKTQILAQKTIFAGTLWIDAGYHGTNTACKVMGRFYDGLATKQNIRRI